MKPFVFAAAFENGMYPGTEVEDSPLDNRVVMIGGTTGILGEWGPESEENRYEGAITARQALSKSKNGATVRLGLDTGLDPILKLCRNAGIHSQLRPYPSTFLGSSEVTLAELALAYTIFPNGGSRPTNLHILEQIEEKDGTIWHSQTHNGKQNVIKRETAYEVHSCLVDALESGTGKAAHSQFGLKKIPAAGKTGTAYDFTDALFAGYDSSITCVVWAGFDKPQKIYRGAFGRELALPVWVDVMNASAEHYPAKEIPAPPQLSRRPKFVCGPACWRWINVTTASRALTGRRFSVERPIWKSAPRPNCLPSPAMFMEKDAAGWFVIMVTLSFPGPRRRST
jgi:penicillin-binding protein 1A